MSSTSSPRSGHGEFARASLPQDRASTIAVMVALWVWCALLSYPMVLDNPAVVAMGQILGLGLFLVSAGVAYYARLDAIIGSFSIPQIGILVLLFLGLPLQLHGDGGDIISGIIYTCLLLAMALAMPRLWMLKANDLATCLTVASVILCSFGIVAVIVLGWPGGPDGRNIGNIQPNLYATPLLAAFVFSQFRPGIIGIVVRILCLAMAALVSSRFALVGCVIAITVHEITFKPFSPTKIPAIILIVLSGIIFWPQIANILALNDPSRGAGSGISGRDQIWRLAFESIVNHPFGIGFKRSVMWEEGGHNGYLKTLVEFGVLDGGLIFFCLICNLAMAVLAIGATGGSLQQRRFACARFAGLAALLFSDFFQPQIFNLGDALAVAFLFLLFKPGPQWTPIRTSRDQPAISSTT